MAALRLMVGYGTVAVRSEIQWYRECLLSDNDVHSIGKVEPLNIRGRPDNYLAPTFYGATREIRCRIVHSRRRLLHKFQPNRSRNFVWTACRSGRVRFFELLAPCDFFISKQENVTRRAAIWVEWESTLLTSKKTYFAGISKKSEHRWVNFVEEKEDYVEKNILIFTKY